MNGRKPVRVIFEGDAKLLFEGLQASSAANVPASAEKATLLKSILQKAALLKGNPQYGRPVIKRLIPQKYAMAYAVTNLWVVNLSNYWRMVYTIQSDETQVVCFVLEICSHKEYSRAFGFRK